MELQETDTLNITKKGEILYLLSIRISMPPIYTVLRHLLHGPVTVEAMKNCGVNGIQDLIATMASKNYITVTPNR